MAGKTTTACTHEQYETIIKTLYEGIGDCIQPNPRIATILVIEANVGLRIGDTLSLRRSSFIKTPWGIDADMPDYFECIHNYIDHNSNIVRKGAISAKLGEKVLIPINMRDGCILGTGKGNDDWNCSAPHGAGRLMSRSKAKETLSLNDYSTSMSGIYTTSVSEETIDEAPMAYKPIEEIMDCIKDTVDILAVLKPVYNFKASE